ncbi:MAG TPA: hypothetical protein VK771_08515, partial [Acidimicrobiia bacterium]|nr:hypothetical protein [Acidimicrobiia bacterium]
MLPTLNLRSTARGCIALAVTVALSACGASPHRNGTKRDTTTTRTGRPSDTEGQATAPANVYAHTGVNMMSPETRGARSLIYVPESLSKYVDVIDPTTYRVIDRYRTGG